MFGSRERGRLEAQVVENSTTLALHLRDCSQRYDRTAEALNKIEQQLEKSAQARDTAITSLRSEVESRHRENKKWIYTILTGVLVGIVLKALEFVQIGGIPHTH